MTKESFTELSKESLINLIHELGKDAQVEKKINELTALYSSGLDSSLSIMHDSDFSLKFVMDLLAQEPKKEKNVVFMLEALDCYVTNLFKEESVLDEGLNDSFMKQLAKIISSDPEKTYFKDRAITIINKLKDTPNYEIILNSFVSKIL